METLVVVDHRNQYHSQNRGSAKGFRGINCRTFQSGSPFLSPPLTKQFPRTPSPPIKSHSAEPKHFRRIVKSNTISLPIKIKADFHKKGFFDEGFSYSELWAGPAYSNSPLPSALPIPKFSLCNKRSISFDSPGVDVHPIAKSAPPSPTRDYKGVSNRNVFCSADSATKNLRRILNLDVTDD